MKRFRFGIAAAVALLALALTGLGTAGPLPPGPKPGPGAVYTETNAAAGNEIAIYARADDGSLVAAGTVSTGGLGTGAVLGSQGAVVLSKDGHQLFAVNAGDNTVSAFDVRSDGLVLENVVPSGGVDPIGVATDGHLVYVLNAGSPAGISGFRVDKKNGLAPLPGSTQPLSADAASPEQISFSKDGRVLVVAEKGSSSTPGMIDTFQVGHDGLAGAAQANPSVGDGPYGFDFDKQGNLIVSDAGSAASTSYSLSKSGLLSLITGPVSTNGQGAPCWLVVSDDGRYAYTANAASGTISGYAIHGGQLTLLDASGITADLGSGSHPLDEAISTRGGRYFNVLSFGNSTLETFRMNPDGSLTYVSMVTGLPEGDTGLVAV